MNTSYRNMILVLATAVFSSLAGCIKPFNPPPSANNLNFLVVDGTITVGSPVRIKLSRTKNLADTVETVVELGAQLQVESESGSVYPLNFSGTGEYTGDGPSATDRYRLRIRTQDGNEYCRTLLTRKPVRQLIV
jgi:hypothetical protein